MANKIFGIDVSRWQGDFNWEKAKAEGVKFAIIKCGGADDGLYTDSKFLRNCNETAAHGIGIGAYFFGNANTTAEAKKEAEYCLSVINGHQFSYPIYYDVEAARMNVGKAALDNIISTFCDTIKNAGYVAGFYMNYNWYSNYCNGETLAKKYELWIASWGEGCPVPSAKMWQFGGETNVIRSNKVTGITVDQNYCYYDYGAYVREKGLNGFKTSAHKTAEEIAAEVVAGKWGNGDERKKRLTAAGYNYGEIQAIVNERMTNKGNTTNAAKKAVATGDKVTLKANATVYGTNTRFAAFVYKTPLYVREINGDRVVISTQSTGAVTGAVHKDYIVRG